jgi:hypothetical protein
VETAELIAQKTKFATKVNADAKLDFSPVDISARNSTAMKIVEHVEINARKMKPAKMATASVREDTKNAEINALDVIVNIIAVNAAFNVKKTKSAKKENVNVMNHLSIKDVVINASSSTQKKTVAVVEICAKRMKSAKMVNVSAKIRVLNAMISVLI